MFRALLFSGSVLVLLMGECALAEPASSTPAGMRSGSGVRGPVPSQRWPSYSLRAEAVWQLDLPDGERFDASGLLLMPDGRLLTVNDRGPALFEIVFHGTSSSATLRRNTVYFTPDQLKGLAREKIGRYDSEGIAIDELDRIYLCEETNRWILRYDPRLGTVERLEIDWSPVEKYFHPVDRNASFEGVAVGDGKLYVANERQLGRILVVDLRTLQVVDHFSVAPFANQARDVHYSDLSWFDGSLFVLLRASRCVLQVDPRTRRVVAEFSFAAMEQHPEVTYRNLFPTGTMEGLAVDARHIWLVTDNNGQGRIRYPRDTRPTLFKCPRPDVLLKSQEDAAAFESR